MNGMLQMRRTGPKRHGLLCRTGPGTGATRIDPLRWSSSFRSPRAMEGFPAVILSPPYVGLLISQVDFRLRSSADLRSAAILVGIVVMVALVAYVCWWVVVWRDQRRRTSEQYLFADLARAHRLSWSEQRLLLHGARLAGIRYPSSLFLDPGVWDQLANQMRGAELAARLHNLRQRLLPPAEVGEPLSFRAESKRTTTSFRQSAGGLS